MNTRYRKFLFQQTIAVVIAFGATLNALANPTGMTVQSGSATTVTSGSQLTITTGNSALLNWQSFNIAAGETTIFNQPSAYSVVINNIHDANASQIYGSLQANGMVVLMNSSGFYFGPNSFIKTGGLIVSTANCIPPQNSGGSWEFNGPPPLASIVNYGQIQVGNGGSAFLIADQIENHGSITAPGGSIGLAAGQTVLLSDRPDGRGMSMAVTLPSGSVDNEGRLIADGGTIAMNAQVVNQNGFIQANSVQNVNGTIELVASDQLTLGANSQISASGDNSSSGSAGGDVTLQSGNNFSDDVGSQIDVTGGSQGGNGGNVEISAPNVLSLNSGIDASAQPGWNGGIFTLDPENITLGTSGTTSGGTSGTIDGSTGTSGTLTVNVNSAFQNINAGQILLEASGNITLNANTVWNLYTSTGNKTSGLLTLEAGGNIIFGSGSKIYDPNDWSVLLDAGYNFPANSVVSTVGTSSSTTAGNIYLNGSSGGTGNGSIQTTAGSINLEGGSNIQLGSGTVSSSDGNITWQACGNIQLGNGSQITDGNGAVALEAGYSFPANSIVSTVGTKTSSSSGNIYLNGGNNGAGSGSIATTAGDINLEAGNNIQLGSGTVSSSDGNITWQVCGNVQLGNGSQIVDGNGAVTLEAGYNFANNTVSPGSSSTAGNIYLNGGNNGAGSGSIATTAGDINLEAGNGIQIGSGAVNSSAGNVTWQAGGGITFGDGSQISDGSGSVTLDAGYNFANNTVNFNVGNIYLNGGPNGDGVGGLIQTVDGNINLMAGQNILVGSGYVITTGGGNIYAQALAGNIDTGSDAQGYYFGISGVNSLSQAYNLSDGLGGISTAAGGDVTLIAGGNVTSVLPGNGVYYYDGNQESPNNNDYLTAGSGAYGSQLGNVTIVAGGNVTGNYLVANGTGAIYAGVKMVNGIPVDANGNPVTDGKSYVLNSSSTGSAGTSDNELALNLIAGGWTVDAAQDIYLQEVRNPNGVFDINGGRSFSHYFDYAPDDYVDLNAGNLVQLGASPSILPRPTGIPVPFIYPSILNINAGAGGVELVGGSTDPFNQLILFPSPQGSLTINTTDGGSLVGELASSGGVPQIFNIIVSDSGSQQLTTSSSDANCTFGMNDHAATPIHAATPADSDNATPIALNISGDMSLVMLTAPEAAQINVVGDMYNCRFQGMNLYANDVTSINVGQTAKVNMENSGILNPATDGSLTVGGNIINRGIFTSVTLDLNQAGVQAPDMDYLSEAYGNQIGTTSISPATLTTSLYYNPNTGVLTYQNISGVTIAKVLNLLQNLTIQTGVDSEGNSTTTTVSVLTPATAQALLAQYNAENEAGHVPDGSGPPDGTYGFTLGGGGQFNITARTIDLGTTAGIQSEGVGLYTVRNNYSLASLFGNGGVFDHGADITITTTGNHSAGETAGDLVGDLDMYSSSIASLQGGSITIYSSGDVNAGSADFSVNGNFVRGIYSTAGGNMTVIADGDINVNGSRIATYDGGNVTVESLNGNINAGTGTSRPVGVQAYYEDPNTHIVYSTTPQIPFSGIMALTLPARDASYPAPTATLGNILVEAPNGDINANVAGILQVPLNDLNYPDAVTTVLAGYELRDNMGNPVTAGDMADGMPVFVSANRNIDCSGSGIVACNASLDASGNIVGLIFARNNIDINAQQNVNVDALGGQNVNVNSSGGRISGEFIGGTGVSASGLGGVDASLISANVSGATSGQSGLGQGTAANATSQSMASEDTAKMVASSDKDGDKKKEEVALAEKVGRVTVILPEKESTKKESAQNQTPTQRL